MNLFFQLFEHKEVFAKYLKISVFIAFIIVSILHTRSFAQNNTILPDYFNIIYPNIKFISDGPRIYHISFLEPPYKPGPGGEYSFYFRFIVTRWELWNGLYLEKIGLYDEEGIDRRLAAGIQLPLDELFPSANFTEQRLIESVAWIDSITAEITINQVKYKIDVTEYIQFQIY